MLQLLVCLEHPLLGNGDRELRDERVDDVLCLAMVLHLGAKGLDCRKVFGVLAAVVHDDIRLCLAETRIVELFAHLALVFDVAAGEREV